jgi:hypothetical protein
LDTVNRSHPEAGKGGDGLTEVEAAKLDGSFVRKHLTGTEILRPTVINWQNEIVAIADAYLQHRGLVHGVQKDAIQNSWDARTDKKGRNWSTSFELVEGKGTKFLVFCDRGTTGLTGRVLQPEEMEQDLPEEERWGRFESLAFTKTTEQERTTLGSRGRGKFIFVAASKEYTILYDSLRKDGSYRLGARWVEKTQSPVYSWENEDAKQMLSEITNGVLQPLSEVGARVIIVNPVDELVNALRNGNFARFIGETWWEILEKYQVKTLLRFDRQEIQVPKPAEFVLPEKDSKDYVVWMKRDEKQSRGNVSFLVKRLHIVSNRKKAIPDDLRGIAVQRGGLKICAISHRYLPQNIAETLYGYLTVDEDTEIELRLLEDPEHYSFDFSRGVARAIREYVQEEIEKFAKEKLGWGADIRQIKRGKQQEAEREAMWAANRIAKKLKLLGKTKSRTKRHGKKGRHWKEIRLRFASFAFPKDDTIRVDWGEKLKDMIVEIVNDTAKSGSFRLKVFARYFDKVVKDLLEKDVQIQAGKAVEVFGPHSEHIEKRVYREKGKYFVVARINSLMDDNRGAEVDEVKQAFYVEKDPPETGLFEKCEPIATDPAWMGTTEGGEESGWKLVYNVDHPSYRASEETVDAQKEYLFRLMAFGICKIDLETESEVLIKDADSLDPSQLAEKIQEGFGKIMHLYHG